MKKISSLIFASMLILGGISVAGPAVATPGGGNNNNNNNNNNNPAVCYLYTQQQTGRVSAHPSGWNAGDTGLGWSLNTPQTVVPCDWTSPSPTTSASPVSTPSASQEPTSSQTSSPAPVESTSPAPTSDESTPAGETPSPTSSDWTPEKCSLPEGSTYMQEFNSGMGKTTYRATAPEGFNFIVPSEYTFLLPFGDTHVVDFQGPIPSKGGFCPELGLEPAPLATDAPWGTDPATPPATHVTPSHSAPAKVTKPTPVASSTLAPVLVKAPASVKAPVVSKAPVQAPVTVQQNRGLNIQTGATSPATTATASEGQSAPVGADKTIWALVGGALALLGLLLLVGPKLARRKH